MEIRRTIQTPDPGRMEFYRRDPALGPKILFFSGGSALKKTSEELIHYTHNSIHIVTPVDSGGSSAKLREAFGMPAIGDIRNRLMALADRSLTGNPEIFRLFAHRFPKSAENATLREQLDAIVEGDSELVRPIPDPMRKIVRQYLYDFRAHMPDGFDLRGASVGNLVLAGGYLGNRRHLDPVIYVFSKLVNVRGTVRPVTKEDLHLVADLKDGTRIVGQHRLTGKEEPPIASAVKRVFLSRSRRDPAPAAVSIREKIKQLIAEAVLICYPMGSFYSSLVANLLPAGVGAAIAANPCPKIFIPSTGSDPEVFGTDLQRQVETLTAHLRQDAPDRIRAKDVLHFILLDERPGLYAGDLDTVFLERNGIEPIRCRLVSTRSAPLVDEKLLVPILLSLA